MAVSSNNNSAGDVNISTTGTIASRENGIFAHSNGSGNVSVTSTGVVESANLDGISANNLGTGATTVTVSNTVIGGTTGISTTATAGNTVNITLDAGSDVSATSSLAINDTDADATVNINNGATVTGEIRLGNGSDIINISSGSDISGVTVFDGGDDADGADGFVDVISIAGGAIDASTILNFEEVNFNSGLGSLIGALDTGLLTVASGATLDAANGASVTSGLTNNGVFTIASSNVGTVALGDDFTQTGSGTIVFDIANGNSDRLTVDGTANLAGTITVNQSDFTPGTTTLIDASALNGTFDVENIGESGLLLFNDINYDTANGDVNLVSGLNDAANVDGLTVNQISVANALVGDFVDGNLVGPLNDIAVATGTLGNPVALAKVLEELHPEELIAGIQIFQNSQTLFANNLIGQTNTSVCSRKTSKLEDSRKDCAVENRVWGTVQYVNNSQDGTFSGVDYESDGFEITAGVSNLGNDWFTFGVAGGYANIESTINSDGDDRVNTEFFRLGGNIRADLNRSSKGPIGHVDVVGLYGRGQNDVSRQLIATDIGLTETQTANPTVKGLNGLVRLSLDGANGNYWPFVPFVQFSADTVEQEQVSFGSGATALTSEEIESTRTSFGAGLKFEKSFENAFYIKATGTALFHGGDTDASFDSRFNSATADGTSFTTIGEAVEEQFILDGGLGRNFSDGWAVNVNGFAEFGDFEGFGGRLYLEKQF